MNTGEHEWMVPTGNTPARVQRVIEENNLDVGNTGTGALVPMTVTPNMLIYSDTETDGTPMLYAVNKSTGETEAAIEVPGRSRYGMSTGCTMDISTSCSRPAQTDRYGAAAAAPAAATSHR